MPVSMDFTELVLRFDAYPDVLNWLIAKTETVRADSTIIAYSNILSDYLAYCTQRQIDYIQATSQQVADYFDSLTNRPITRNNRLLQQQLSDSSRKFRLAVLRNFFLYLQEEGIRHTATPIRHSFSAQRKQELIEDDQLPVKSHNSWMPDSEQWGRILHGIQAEPLRNQVMFYLAFECSLSRKELCELRVNDVARGIKKNAVFIRAETTKELRAKREQYSDNTKLLLQQYLDLREQGPHQDNEALFISESKRNKGQGISEFTWGAVVKGIADRTGLHQLTSHTLLRLSKHPDYRLWEARVDNAKTAAEARMRSAGQTQLRSARRIIKQLKSSDSQPQQLAEIGVSVPPNLNWKLTSQELPPPESPESKYSAAVDILIVIGDLGRECTQAKYYYVTQEWVSMRTLEPYEEICWVTHWKEMVKWPEPLSQEDISKHRRSLLPAFSPAMPYYRVIFDNVPVANFEQKDSLLQLVLSCVKSNDSVCGKGHLMAFQYYIDVRLKNAVHLRRLMMRLLYEPVIHTIRPYEGKEYESRGNLDHLRFPKPRPH
jgi:integrase/recombinase XerD